ncbi:MAG: ABC transporter permease [Candidatus Nanopusillus acidilobi]|jgi:peptide/nickel transport system permease protein
MINNQNIRINKFLKNLRYLNLIILNRIAFISIIIIFIFIIIGVLAPIISPYPLQGEGAPNLAARLQPPSINHLFGTDQYGRDILSRIFFGIQTALIEGVSVVMLGIIIGVPLGIIAGYYGGKTDEIIMRITDMFLAFPYLLLALIIVATLGSGLINVIIALSITWWPWYTRIARAQTVSLKARPFVLSAKLLGMNSIKIILRHILPNSFTPIIIQGTLDFAGVILSASGLSFLGIGIKEPMADLGLMISEGQTYFLYYWWVATFPGLILLIIAIAFNLLGDSLRDILDPKYQKRRILQIKIRSEKFNE